MFRVYAIVNAAGRRYIGLSANVTHRLCQHNNGQSRWSKSRGPMPLGEARKLENALKRQKAGRGLRTLMQLHGS